MNKGEIMKTLQGHASAFKWAGLRESMMECAQLTHCKIDFLSRSSGLLRETVFYRVECSDKSVENFSTLFLDAVSNTKPIRIDDNG